MSPKRAYTGQMASKTKKKIGRPSKLTTKRKRKLLAAIRLGTTYLCAAHEAGIEEKTLYNWLDRGRNATTGEYHAFFQDFYRARSEAETSLVRAIKNAATTPSATRGDYRAAAWILEKRWSGKYGKRSEEAERTRLELEKLEADVELSKARAELAKKTTERGTLPLTVIFGDISGGISDEELRAASPTIAHELGGSDGEES